MAINLPRRKFLQHLSSSAACLAFFSPATAFAITNKHKGEAEDILSFIDLEGLGPQINTEYIDHSHIALHRAHQLPSQMIDQSQQSYVEWVLRGMVAKQGLQWDETDQVVWTSQHYGYCDHSTQCDKLLNYAMSAQDFLYNTLRGLLDIKINWHVLSGGFNFSEQGQNQFNGYIGRYTYLVQRVNLVDAEGEIKYYGLIRATPVNKAINFITSTYDIPNTSLMYIIPGNTSLVSPFSELLHLITHGPSRRLAQQLEEKYDKQHAEATSHMIGETITESAAVLMAQKYLQKHHYSDRMKLISAHARNLGNHYLLVPDTVAYMGHNGIQQTLKTFIEDPLHLVKKISNSRKTMGSLRIS